MRVGPSDVQVLLAEEVDPAVLTALITDASAWVDAHLVGKGLSATILTAVEKYLAAHLGVLTLEGGEGQLVASERADISEKYAERNQNVGATSHLLSAAAFDRTGLVREHWAGGKRVQFRVGSGFDFTGAGG